MHLTIRLMEFRLTEKDFWHDRLSKMGKARQTEGNFGKQMTGEQARALHELRGCTFSPRTLSKSPNPVVVVSTSPKCIKTLADCTKIVSTSKRG